MKVCESCGTEIGGRDGENLCEACDMAEGEKKILRNQRSAMRRREGEEVMRSLGLVKVRGALGGTYWE